MRVRTQVILEVIMLAAVAVAARLIAGASGSLSMVVTLLDGRRNDIYPAIIGLAGSLLGFTIASFTVVIGYTGNPRLEVIRRSEQWDNLFTSFTASIRWTAYTTGLSLVAVILDTEESASFVMQSALIIALGITAVVIARMIWVLHGLLIVVARPGNRAPGK